MAGDTAGIAYGGKGKMRDLAQDKVMYAIFNTLLIAFGLCVLYPCVYVVSASFSSAPDVSSGRVVLWPVNFSLAGYEMVFSHKLVLRSYLNTFFYTAAGTLINLVMTIFAAYPLTRKELPFRNVFMFLFMLTMFFSGGLIPTYFLMNSLGLVNTIWIMILPTFSVGNMILMRTNFMTVPSELFDAAEIDGCSYWQYLVRVLLPLSKAVLAVITLSYAVGYWNSYFGALIYLKDRDLYPLQLVLRDILNMAKNKFSMSDINTQRADDLAKLQGMVDLIKYSLIVVATAPILALYPFIQKYFVKGIMIGSLKG